MCSNAEFGNRIERVKLRRSPLVCLKTAMISNSVDPDQMPQNVASDLGLHCFVHAYLSKYIVIMVITELLPVKQKLAFHSSRKNTVTREKIWEISRIR